MSTWRDIWKKSIKANRLYSLDENMGNDYFAYLSKKYETKKEDGMIKYALAEALEYRNQKKEALKNYEAAKALFPVEHWQNVAQQSIERLSANKSDEDFFNKNDFKDLLWYTFQKVYEYIYLDDFVRYVCLSAISRADSEWPLSLVDFRSVLELQIKTTFQDIVQKYIDEQNYSLSTIINELKTKKLISGEIANAMHKIRKSGNAATHQMKLFDEDEENNYWDDFNKDDSDNLNHLLMILEFFNTYNRKHNIQFSD